MCIILYFYVLFIPFHLFQFTYVNSFLDFFPFWSITFVYNFFILPKLKSLSILVLEPLLTPTAVLGKYFMVFIIIRYVQIMRYVNWDYASFVHESFTRLRNVSTLLFI